MILNVKILFFKKENHFFVLGLPLLTTKQNCLEIGNRRTFSCRINSKTKPSDKATTTHSTGKYPIFALDSVFYVYLIDNYMAIDFVGYIKHYSLTDDNQNDIKPRVDRRRSSLNTLTPADVFNAIGTNPVSCLITMGNLSKRIEKTNQTHENINSIDRMFLCKLNPDGQFTYFDQM